MCVCLYLELEQYSRVNVYVSLFYMRRRADVFMAVTTYVFVMKTRNDSRPNVSSVALN